MSDQWIDAAPASDVPEGDVVGIVVAGRDVAPTKSKARSSPPTTCARTARRASATASWKARKSNAPCTRAASTSALARPWCAPLTEDIRTYPVRIENGRVLLQLD